MKIESGTYLKTADAKQNDQITFQDEGSWVESQNYKYDDGNPRQDFVIKVMHAGSEKKMRINKTNRDTLVSNWGDETKDWVGKTATITKENVMVAGKKCESIVLVIGAGPAAAAPGDTPF